MPSPQSGHTPSLTMQYALSVPDNSSATLVLNTPSNRPPPPAIPPRPHSDEPRITSGLNASPERPQRLGVGITPSGPPRASSSPSLPITATAGSSAGKGEGSDTVQCSGFTKKGERCTRQVKTPAPLNVLDPDAGIPRFCFQHTKEVLEPSGFHSRKGNGDNWITFSDWIPDYLHPDTQAALRVEMEKPASQADVPGYIYTFEIRDPDLFSVIHLKVGRAVNLNKRIDQWGKQCGSKEQVLRGWWPGTVENDGDGDVSLMKVQIKAGEKGSNCHRLERLVHLELADLVSYAPYLYKEFPKKGPHAKKEGSDESDERTSRKKGPRVKRRVSDDDDEDDDEEEWTPSKKGSRTKRKDSDESDERTPSKSPAKKAPASPAKAGLIRKPCPDCGQMHKEIFSFRRPERGRYKGREWELIVKPVIEKWGAFVEAYV